MKIKSSSNYSIRKRSNGTYEARFTVNGKQYSAYAKTRELLLVKVRQYKKSIITNLKNFNSKNVTLRDFYSNWIKLYKKPFVAPSTLMRVERVFNRYILPTMAHMLLKDITTDQIQKLVVSLQDKHRQQTITLLYLNACFKQAVNNRLLTHNPCNGVVYKKQESTKGLALTLQQEQQFISYLEQTNHKLTNLFKFYLYTGVRRLEALTMELSDIDFLNHTITIKGTKTSKSYRKLKTSNMVLSLIPIQEKPFDFNPDYVSKQFTKVMKILGFENLTLHSLRHTFATRCYSAGIDLKMVQYWLGHSTIKLTADTYTHIEEITQENALKLLKFDS